MSGATACQASLRGISWCWKGLVRRFVLHNVSSFFFFFFFSCCLFFSHVLLAALELLNRPFLQFPGGSALGHWVWLDFKANIIISECICHHVHRIESVCRGLSVYLLCKSQTLMNTWRALSWKFSSELLQLPLKNVTANPNKTLPL